MPRDGTEIGPTSKPVREVRAIETTEPSEAPPAPSPKSETISHLPIGTAETPRRRKSASPRSEPTAAPRSSAPIGSVSNGGAGDDGQRGRDTQGPIAIVAQIIELHKVRAFCIKSQSRCDRSIESLLAQSLGYHGDMTEKERKAVFRQAGDIRRSVEKGGEGQNRAETQAASALSAIIHLIPLNAASRKLWDDRRVEVEAGMGKLVKRLPIYPWIDSVRGLGVIGSAILIGAAGIPIGDYRTVSGLWSRLGLAVHDGKRQSGAHNKVQLVNDRGERSLVYSKARRADAWSICSDSLFRAQWRGDKDEDGKDPSKSGNPVAVPAHPIGPYGEVYAQRRAHTAPRIEATADLPDQIGDHANPDKWTKGRCHNDARRIMTKALLRDFWANWREVGGR